MTLLGPGDSYLTSTHPLYSTVPPVATLQTYPCTNPGKVPGNAPCAAATPCHPQPPPSTLTPLCCPPTPPAYCLIPAHFRVPPTTPTRTIPVPPLPLQATLQPPLFLTYRSPTLLTIPAPPGILRPPSLTAPRPRLPVASAALGSTQEWQREAWWRRQRPPATVPPN